MEKITYRDILILGDSFCSHRDHQDHWPQIVMNKLLGTEYSSMIVPRGQGYPGASWWSVRKRLLKELRQPPKIAIFCHTEPQRIPHKDDWGINFRSVELGQIHVPDSFDQPMPPEFKKACELYYNHLWMEDYHNWAMVRWFEELNSLVRDIDIVLHFYSFPEDKFKYTFKKGVTFEDPLINYQVQKKMFSLKEPKSANHYSVENNRQFAEVVLKYINNYPGDGVRIKEKLL